MLTVEIPSFQVIIGEDGPFVVYNLILHESSNNLSPSALNNNDINTLSCSKRYNDLRQFHLLITPLFNKEQLGKLNFPSKLIFGNLKKENIEKRQVALETYFQTVTSFINNTNLIINTNMAACKSHLLTLFQTSISTNTTFTKFDPYSINDSPRNNSNLQSNNAAIEDKTGKYLLQLSILVNENQMYWLPFQNFTKNLDLQNYLEKNDKTLNALQKESFQYLTKTIETLLLKSNNQSLLKKTLTFMNDFTHKFHQTCLHVGASFKVLLHVEEVDEQDSCIKDLLKEKDNSFELATSLEKQLEDKIIYPITHSIYSLSSTVFATAAINNNSNTINSLINNNNNIISGKVDPIEIYLCLFLLSLNDRFIGNDMLLTCIDLNNKFCDKCVEYNNSFLNKEKGFDDEYSYFQLVCNNNHLDESNFEKGQKYSSMLTHVWNSLDERKGSKMEDKLKSRLEVAKDECEKKIDFYLSICSSITKIADCFQELNRKCQKEKKLILECYPELKQIVQDVQNMFFKMQQRCDVVTNK
ncbi:hypothetical protein ABK040_008887 [Willaertia magna]